MGKRGSNTRPAQQRLNIRNSHNKLVELLVANFQDGAQLVTLTYREDLQAPSCQLAELQLLGWLRTARDKQGPRLRYIRATDPKGTGNNFPVHRVVIALPWACAASLAARWEYGPTIIEPLQKKDLEPLAAILMRPALGAERVPVPCARTWSPSAGLIRREKKGVRTV